MLKAIMNQISREKKYKQKRLRDGWNYFMLSSKSTVKTSGKISTLPKKQPSKGKNQVQNYIHFI